MPVFSGAESKAEIVDETRRLTGFLGTAQFITSIHKPENTKSIGAEFLSPMDCGIEVGALALRLALGSRRVGPMHWANASKVARHRDLANLKWSVTGGDEVTRAYLSKPNQNLPLPESQ